MSSSKRRPGRKEAWRRQQRTRTRRRIFLGSVVGLAILAVAVLVTGYPGSGDNDAAPAGTQDPVLGDASAPVTIVEYGDFKCPFCTRFSIQTEPELRKKYVDTGKVRLVWKDFPYIDAESRPAG